MARKTGKEIMEILNKNFDLSDYKFEINSDERYLAKSHVYYTCKEHGRQRKNLSYLLLNLDKGTPCGKCNKEQKNRKQHIKGSDFLKKIEKYSLFNEFEYPDLDLNRIYHINDEITQICKVHGPKKYKIGTINCNCSSCINEKRNLKKGSYFLEEFSKYYDKDDFSYLDLELDKLYNKQSKLKIKCNKTGNIYNRPIYDHIRPSRIESHKKRMEKEKNGKYYLDKLYSIYGDEFDFNIDPKKIYSSVQKIEARCKNPNHEITKRCIYIFLERKSKCKECYHDERIIDTTKYTEIFKKKLNNFKIISEFSTNKKYKQNKSIEIECKKCNSIFKHNLGNIKHNFNGKCFKCEKDKNAREIINGVYNEKFHIKFPEKIINLVSNETIELKCKKCNFISNKKIKDLSEMRSKKNYNFKCPSCEKGSYIELYFKKILNSFYIKNKFIINDRKILDGLEIDFLLEDINTGFELNGIYWHSNIVNDDNNHMYNKFIKSKQKGINLIHLYEDEFNIQKRDLHNNKINAIIKEILLFKKSLNIDEYNYSLLTIKKITKDKFIKFFKSHSLEFFNNKDNKFNGIYYKGYLLGVFSFNKETNIVNNYCINYNINDDLELIKELYPDLVFNVRNDSYNRFKFENNNYKIISEIEPSYRNFNQKGKGKIINRRLEKIDPEHPIRIYDAGRVLVKLK